MFKVNSSHVPGNSADLINKNSHKDCKKASIVVGDKGKQKRKLNYISNSMFKKRNQREKCRKEECLSKMKQKAHFL